MITAVPELGGFAGRLPDGAFPEGLGSAFADRWAMALTAWILAMVVYLVGFWMAALIANHDSQSFREFLASLFSHHFVVLAPAVLVGMILLVVAPATGEASRRGAQLADLSLLVTLVLSLIVLLGDLLGMVIDISYVSRGFAQLAGEGSIHLAAAVVGAGSGIWAWGELAARRRSSGGDLPPTQAGA